jgi:hypothetical protein
MNTNLNLVLKNARSSKKDEFYTLYEDVKFELDHYLDQFKDKVVYCPCDTKDSAFVKYFLELKDNGLIKDILYTSINDGIDCLSDDAIIYYNKADIIVTNPPFSLFRSIITLLISLNKLFVLWSTNNAILYKCMHEYIKYNKVRPGYITGRVCEFKVPSEYAKAKGTKAYISNNEYFIKVPSITTFTNLKVVRESKLVLTKHYNDYTYYKYDNFDAINCDKSSDIPVDYYGYIGVPITYLYKHDPNEFNIIGIFNHYDKCDIEHGHITGNEIIRDKPPYKYKGPLVNGKAVYVRIIIQRKQ